MKIALFHGHGFISWAIRCQTRGKYSHAAFITETGNVYEAWTSGVRKLEKLKRGVEGIDLFDPHLSRKEDQRLIEWLEKRVGLKYDFWGVFNFVLRITPDEDNSKEFCSELVAEGMAAIGRPLFKTAQPWEIAPSHLAWSLGLEQITDDEKAKFFARSLGADMLPPITD